MKKFLLSISASLLLSLGALAQNTPPVVSDIPDQTIDEGGTFVTIALDDFVTDAETNDPAISWTFTGNSQLTISVVSRVVTINIPNVNWNGSETITFTATDNGTPALSASDAATFTVTAVNDAPVVTNIPNQTVPEGTPFATIALDNYVSDVETPDASIAWTYSGNVELSVSIVNRVATIGVPDVNWNGSESITFTATDNDATDPLSASDAATFTVTAVNDVPVVTDIPDQTVAEGTPFTTILLDDYVSDVETADAAITWTYSGNTNLAVSIVDRVATISVLDPNWNGSETITFTATDIGTPVQSASDPATFTVTAVNDAPVVTDIPDQTVAEGTPFTTILLDNYVSDVETPDAAIAWTYSGNTQLTVSIVNRVATIGVPDVNWNGSESITFTATDNDATDPLSASDAATFTVTAVNDVPVVTDIPDQTIDEGATFATIPLDDYVSDVETPDAAIVWTYSGNTELTVSIVNRVATIGIPDVSWNGSETITFTATDTGTPAQSASDAATFTVTAANTAPVVTDIPDQSVAEGSPFATILLDNFVSDVETPDAAIAWTYSGNTNLTVSIVNRVATIGVLDVNWNGSETITFTATDNDATDPLSASDAATFTVTAVNDAPVVTDIPDQTVAEGTLFATIALDGYVSDVETPDAAIAWTYSGNTNLAVSIVDRVATISVLDPNWNGSETITFTATDNDATDPLSASDAATFTVTAVNDVPVVTDIPDQTVAEGTPFATIPLDNFVSDVETPDAAIVWTYTGNTNLTVSIVDRVATIGVVDVNWNGSETITFTATDNGSPAQSASDAATFTVTAVNDAPVVTSIPDTVATENLPYSSTITATDVDAGDSLRFSAPLLPLWLDFNDTTQVLSGTPGNNEVGYHTLTLRVSDGTLNVDTTFTIHVYNVNDAPTFTSMPDTMALEDTPYLSGVQAEDIDGDSVRYSAPLLPAWLSFNDTTGILSGTPVNEDVGDHNVTLRISDGTVQVDSSFVIHVINTNDAPTFSSIPDTMALQDAPYLSTVTATDVDGDSVRYSATRLPAWLTFNDTTQILSGTPLNADVGDDTITLRISDSLVVVDTTFIIHVENVNDAPVFTGIPDTVTLQNALYSSTVLAIDIDGDSVRYSAILLPAWLIFNDTTQILSGTPGNDDVGYNTVTLRISDSIAVVDTTFVIEVIDVNDPPTFTTLPNTTVLQGEPYSYTPTAEDIDGDSLRFDAPVLPGWLSFDPLTHLLSGTPENDDVGNNSVSLRINDSTVNVVQSFVIVVINVNDPPTFTSVPVTEARPGSAYEYTLTAVDIDGDDLTYTAIVLPGWLTFNASTHTLSATPGDEDVGDQFVTIRVSDGELFVDQTFIITVDYGNHAPTFISDPATTAVVNQSYNYTIEANDIDGDDLTYSAPVLPGWLSYNAGTHQISGTPGSANLGRHDVTVRVSDGTVSADQSFPITVLNENSPPSFISTPDITVSAGDLYTYTATAADVDGDNLNYYAILLPDWLVFETSTHILHGTPYNADAGDHEVTLAVSDGKATVEQHFVITVEFESGIGTEGTEALYSMKLYPNPSEGRFFLELSREFEEEATLEIMSSAGKVLLQEVMAPFQKIQEELDLSDQPAGIYFIRVYYKSFRIVGKLMLQ